jgi:xanthosine utilization system XapX-like protein
LFDAVEEVLSLCRTGMFFTRMQIKTVVLHFLSVRICSVQIVDLVGLYGKLFYYQIYQWAGGDIPDL